MMLNEKVDISKIVFTFVGIYPIELGSCYFVDTDNGAFRSVCGRR